MQGCDGAYDDDEVDHTGSSGGDRTTNAGGDNIIVLGDEETNASLRDGVRDHDRAYDDGEVNRTGSGGGEGTNGPRGINGVIVGNGETNGSLGDGVREHDGYQQPRRVRAGIEAGCASALEEAWTEA